MALRRWGTAQACTTYRINPYFAPVKKSTFDIRLLVCYDDLRARRVVRGVISPLRVRDLPGSTGKLEL